MIYLLGILSGMIIMWIIIFILSIVDKGVGEKLKTANIAPLSNQIKEAEQ